MNDQSIRGVLDVIDEVVGFLSIAKRQKMILELRRLGRPMDYELQDQLMAAIEHLITDPDESLSFRPTEEGGLQIVWRREPGSGDRDRTGDGMRTAGDPSNLRHHLRHHAMTYARFRGGPAAGLAADLEGMRHQLMDADLIGPEGDAS